MLCKLISLAKILLWSQSNWRSCIQDKALRAHLESEGEWLAWENAKEDLDIISKTWALRTKLLIFNTLKKTRGTSNTTGMDIPPFYRTDVTIIKIMHSVWALTLQRDVKHWKESTRKLWKVWKMCINMRYFRSIIQCRWGGTFVISVVVLRDIWREVLVFRKWQNSESKTRIKMRLEIRHILVCYRIKLSVKLFWNNAKLSIKKMEIFFKDTLQFKHKQQKPLIQYGGGTTTRLYSAIPFLKLDDSRKRPRCLLVYQQKKEQDPGISKRKDFFVCEF